jgi:hypothetical protein
VEERWKMREIRTDLMSKKLTRWSNRFWCFKIRARSSGGLTAQKSVRFLQFSLHKLNVSVPLYLVPVPHYYGTVVPSGTTSLVPSIFPPLDQGGRMVPKNTNHYKTCNTKYRYKVSIDFFLVSSFCSHFVQNFKKSISIFFSDFWIFLTSFECC